MKYNKTKDCAPKVLQVVYTKGDLIFVPRHKEKGWIGPGYYYHNNKVYFEEDFNKMKAKKTTHHLWDLKQ